MQPTHRAGTGLAARALRGSALTVGGFAMANALRLGSNLILARLLFPEAFGLMALVTVLLVGLAMFSDIGLTPAIQGSKRGDDPAFLGTAFTLQIARGVLVAAAAALLAWPMAQFYGEPLLLPLILASALNPFIMGFVSIRKETAQRHLMLGRVTVLELTAQVVGLIVSVGLAWATGSVWALIFGALAASLAQVLGSWTLLAGPSPRPRLERAAAGELIGFGKWIFLSTIAGFLALQSDKLVLGRYLSMGEMGIYNIAFFLASFPLLLGHAVNSRLMVPIYRETRPGTQDASDRRLRRIRLALTGFMLALTLPLVLGGAWLVDVLYDDRYAAAGSLLVLLALAQGVQMIGLTYDQGALAAGDSRGFFLVTAVRGGATVLALLLAVPALGAPGAALALALAALLAYPLQLRLARSHRVWHPAHDALTVLALLILGALALALHGLPLAGQTP